MNKDFLEKLRDLVEANLENEKFGVEDLIRGIGMSHSNLHRKLKASLNQTISQFIREVRLKKAKELLLSENLTVSEISYRVGFGSPTYFNKCFHEYFGFAPGELKNRAEESGQEEPPEELHRKKFKRKRILLIGFTVIIVLLSVFLIANISDSKSIALLPFKYLSEEKEKQYLADAMMDAIHFHLSKVEDIRVVPRTSVEQYRANLKTVKKIGRELNVDYLLEGSFFLDSTTRSLILKLIRTKDEKLVWSDEYDLQKEDPYRVQSQAAIVIADKLQAQITPKEIQSIKRSPTVDLTKYDYYQRGMIEFEKFETDNRNRKALEKAANSYRKALHLDEKFAQAYVGLAWVYRYKNFWETYLSKHFMDSVLIFANIALSYDNKLAEAYLIRGNCYYLNGDQEQALREYDKAIKFDPNNCKAFEYKARINQWILNDYVEAIRNFQEAKIRAREKNLPDILSLLGRVYLDAGFIDAARKYYQEALSLNEDTGRYYSNLTLLEACQENFEKALDFARKAYQTDPNFVFDLPLYCAFVGHDEESFEYAKEYVKNLEKSGNIPLIYSHRIGYAFWKEGKLDEAKYYFNQQIKYDLESIKLGRFIARNGAAYYDLAAVYAFLGDKSKAYSYLDEFSKRHSLGLWWISFLKHDPLFANIRMEARFQSIVNKLYIKHKAEQERVGIWLKKQKML